ncbi:dTDP-4-dehydrorhamnose reductase [Trinickia caryophylli]|uniref:dTDP-4-dehydrorhamnose reductase n=1 Tax=Trinickia caryophylli TaxID=28094 RepID=A0A1X7CI37_TRICW|nr:dTDP-4-dehydrorhamnose reductase [Trinickia caryophylli]PMS11551.1 dTDP-4-dehydrorhamnose reductase [Trinickia caryophylli]TRX19896.1 dTDP-4-dehydrorhamnose reductase [Trinickia caryophylli]WQE13609.1 dTDP-4-dehydrorhamnose reductase [Trinickia caryophylli]SME96881.1 dTDP-4-dehydrorhamnose reductase [Trinickia caryophylli]GLU30484.1 NAD(P)-dependent oxidoreductase [Trinickia caryophylli]
MKILVTGRQGQVGWELRRALAPLGEVVAVDRSVADLAKPQTLAAVVASVRPAVIVNAAAYTAVDQAEQDEAAAHVVNAQAVGVLAELARGHGALFVHYSTDYVFDGSSSVPYTESDPPMPINAYGRSKLAGEQAIEAAGGDWLTLRTTWVYAPRGRNFLRTMLRLAGERDTLKVVADQTGAPTPARTIADLTAHAVATAQRERAAGSFESGIFHMTAAGQTTWHGFASAIVESARAAMPETIKTAVVEPIGSEAYPTPARRPKYSLLDNGKFERRFGLHRVDWRDGLAMTLEELWAR